MKSGVELTAAAALLVALSHPVSAQERGRPAMSAAEQGPQADYPVTIGDPYEVNGVQHVPVDVLNFDQVGYAGTIPDGFAGQPTSRGEAYVPSSVVGAHKTLPLPTYAEVTSLATGKTILVRLIERGPMDNARLIDLSPGARAQLGHPGDDSIAVRLRRVNPPEAERALLRSGGQAPERMDTPQALLTVLKRKLDQPAVAAATTRAPARPRPVTAPMPATVRPATPAPVAAAPRPPVSPAPRPVPEPAPDAASTAQSGRFIVEQAGRPSRAATPAAAAAPTPPPTATTRNQPAIARAEAVSASGYVVQVAAFSSRSRADALARQLDAGVSGEGNVWRVRYGPFSTLAQADAQLSRVRARGYRSARVLSAR